MKKPITFLFHYLHWTQSSPTINTTTTKAFTEANQVSTYCLQISFASITAIEPPTKPSEET